MACLLMGHSFGRKIRGRYAPFGFRRYQEDIRFADTHAVQDFAQGIKLSDVFHVGVHTFNSRSLLKGECSVFLKKYLLLMKTIHYPNTIRSHLVTIIPMAQFTPKSTSKLRSALHIRYSKVIPSFISRDNTAQT